MSRCAAGSRSEGPRLSVDDDNRQDSGVLNVR
jgi:hypothetical protein